MSKSTNDFFTFLIYAKVRPMRTKVSDTHTQKREMYKPMAIGENLADLPKSQWMPWQTNPETNEKFVQNILGAEQSAQLALPVTDRIDRITADIIVFPTMELQLCSINMTTKSIITSFLWNCQQLLSIYLP